MSTKMTSYSEVATDRKVIALTFDDGPHPTNTPELLKVLRDQQVKATFYVLGAEAEKYPDVLRSIADHGHEIGNHTYSHPSMPGIADEDKRREIDRTNRAIERAIGCRPSTFRPPYLEFDDSVLAIAAGFGQPVINGCGTDDWATPGTDHIAGRIREQARSGVIIVCHDGGGDRSQTVEACAIVIPELIAQGYTFVTVRELLVLETEPGDSRGD